MPKFEVIGAPHHHDDGKTYKDGQTVESDKDLDVLFINKFRRVDGLTKKPRDLDESPDTSGSKVMDPPAHKKQDMEKAKTAGDPKKVEKATAKVNSEPDFDPESESDPKFPISSEEPRTGAEPESEEDKESDEEESETESEEGDGEDEPGLGVDVTSQFPDARKVDMLVFRKGGKFHIADKDEPNKATKKGLTKDAAAKYLKTQIKG